MTTDGPCAVVAGSTYATSKSRVVRVETVNRPPNELPTVVAHEVDLFTGERLGVPFNIALTWGGRAWKMPSWYVLQETQ